MTAYLEVEEELQSMPFSAPPYALHHGVGSPGSRVGLVLSGGGVRGAYEVGIIAGVVEALGLGPDDAPPFGIFAGTSVGAINAAFLASNAQRGDLDVGALCRIYSTLQLERHLRPTPWGFMPGVEAARRLRARFTGQPIEHAGHCLLDPAPLEELVRESANWSQLHENVSRGTVRALAVAALNIASGRTTIFAELSPFARYRSSKDERRIARIEQVTPEHVLASAAIPVLFPARRVGDAYFCDGGLRFNTPIAPAIRAGATRLVVVSLLASREGPTQESEASEHYPSIAFLAGKILNALLLDPVHYDLQVLDRLNKLMETVEATLSRDGLEGVQRTLINTRGAPYRRIDTLVFKPSADIGRIAGKHLRRVLERWDVTGTVRRYLDRRSVASSLVEADLASYLLFDGGFAGELVDIGKADALARSEEIRKFFQVT